MLAAVAQALALALVLEQFVSLSQAPEMSQALAVGRAAACWTRSAGAGSTRSAAVGVARPGVSSG